MSEITIQDVLAARHRAAAARTKAVSWAVINVLIALAGALITVATYANADPGGQYLVMKGAIVFGPIFAVVCTVRAIKAGRVVADFDGVLADQLVLPQFIDPNVTTPLREPASVQPALRRLGPWLAMTIAAVIGATLFIGLLSDTTASAPTTAPAPTVTATVTAKPAQPHRPKERAPDSTSVAGYVPWPGTPLSVRLRQQYRADVVSVQQAMTNMGHPVDVDGHYGPVTEAAVTSVQRDQGLAADGVVGPNTWAIVQRALGNAEDPQQTS